jgi:uncharacterized protein YndB with AHSA1/START domain
MPRPTFSGHAFSRHAFSRPKVFQHASRILAAVVGGLVLVLGSQLSAEVKGSADHGFRVELTEETSATPERVYEATVKQIDKWWDPRHTFSGDAGNLYLEAEPKGWFGERLPEKGFVRHLEVVALMPNRRIGFSGGLGPLQSLGIHGAHTMTFEPHDSGTRIRWVYQVSGYLPAGLGTLAPLVDKVLSEQLTRLVKFVEPPSP